MKFLVWLAGLCLLLALSPETVAQPAGAKIARIDIKHVGPVAVSDEMIRANIRIKPGDRYLRTAVDDDVRNLYSTGLFYNIRVSEEPSPEGTILTYVVQGKPRL